MASIIDNCGFIPTAGGTADWTFFSAVGGYQSPTQAAAANGAVYVVRAQSADLTQWEYAQGAYNSSTGVFARTTVLYNSSGTGTKQGGPGTKITFMQTPSLVAVVALSQDLVTPTNDAVAKAWGQFTQASGTYTNAASFNVASFVKNATGTITVNLSTAFSSVNYALLLTVNQSSGSPVTIQEVLGSRTSSSFQVVLVQTGSNASVDFAWSFAAFGR